MQTGYFNAAWQDIKNSPGWFGKLVLLSLLSLIPIFGWLVVLGYLYGWARDIAWSVHAPLPARIFGNEDGKLYSRGFFALVISSCAAGVPGSSGRRRCWRGPSPVSAPPVRRFGLDALVLASALMGMLIIAASFLRTAVLEQVGTMRMSVYGRLCAGFQFGKVWAMIRHDFSGLLRILGMAILLGLAMAVVVSIFMLAAMLVGHGSRHRRSGRQRRPCRRGHGGPGDRRSSSSCSPSRCWSSSRSVLCRYSPMRWSYARSATGRASSTCRHGAARTIRCRSSSSEEPIREARSRPSDALALVQSRCPIPSASDARRSCAGHRRVRRKGSLAGREAARSAAGLR